MNVKKDKCLACKHPKDDHSVYRELCLINGCKCTKMGGRKISARAEIIARGTIGEKVPA